jgi:CRP/FNR family transcriptional regulator, anaerobic regulatory protein
MLKELEEISYLFESELIREMEQFKLIKKYHENDIIIEVGQEIVYLPFVIDGAIKVMREDDKGDELLLYYLEAGDTCSMTITCCVGKKKSKIKAVSDTDSTLLFLPAAKANEWLGKYESWRNFILTNYDNKLNELLEAIDALAFYNMEERILKYLKDKAKVTGNLELDLTHQEIAEDLHSSRVVISRLLKKMELNKELTIHRNKIFLKSI